MLKVMQTPNLLRSTKNAKIVSDSNGFVVTKNPLTNASIYPNINVLLKLNWLAKIPLNKIAATSEDVDAYMFL